MAASLVATKTYKDINNSTFTVLKADLVGLQDNDLVVVFMAQYDAASIWTVESGFDYAEHSWTAGDDGQLFLGWKKVTDVSAEPATWTFSNAKTEPKTVVVGVFRDVASQTPDAAAVVSAQLNVADHDAPDITTATLGALTITCMTITSSDFGGASATYTPPAGYTLAAYDNSTTDRFSTAAMAYKLHSGAAGLQTIGTWTVAGLDPLQDDSGGVTIAFDITNPVDGGAGSSHARKTVVGPGQVLVTGG